MRTIYVDHAATTYVDQEVIKEMQPLMAEIYGNPSSVHHKGREANRMLESSREKVANILNCKSSEIYFVGSGTESDNLALFGFARKNKEQGNHIITTKIEHHAVSHPCEQLKKEGFEITYLPVDLEGKVDLEELKKSIRKETILISIMYANNEIGTIQPIKEIGEIIAKLNSERPDSKIAFHTDACQAPGALNLNVSELGCDMLTLNGSKMYGPKGIGVLFVKKGTLIEPIIHGGSQEKHLRAGTENLANIIGFAKALELAEAGKEKEVARLIKLRDKLANGLLKKIEKIRLNGHPTDRLPNNVNISILDIEGEGLLLKLDALGVCASSGSACTSGSLDPSHVLLACGLPHVVAHGSLRMSLGKCNSEEDIDFLIEKIPPIVKELRSISALNLDPKNFSKLFNLKNL
ncbi:aminotransferase class V-fold PLP-dependent enzyme [Patescibacteria group bacterium]|nr:aminotransferase class V-fold PLP-dependent enzyme [Patescibacteria group bacterium]